MLFFGAFIFLLWLKSFGSTYKKWFEPSWTRGHLYLECEKRDSRDHVEQGVSHDDCHVKTAQVVSFGDGQNLLGALGAEKFYVEFRNVLYIGGRGVCHLGGGDLENFSCGGVVFWPSGGGGWM